MKNSSPKVLIIDDDPGVLFLHEIIVKEGELHPDPKTFYDAEKALNFIFSQDLEQNKMLIFLDINMPSMSGWEFLEKLGASIQYAEIKVVMVTSSLDKSDREKSTEYELIIDFWEKPMDENQVSDLIQKLGSWLEAS
ncbi:MAG: response regulator [Bacteroidota bacterium]